MHIWKGAIIAEQYIQVLASPKAAALVGCSGQYLLKVVQEINSADPVQDHVGSKLLMHVVQLNRQIAEKVHDGSDRKVSEYTVHRNLSHMR